MLRESVDAYLKLRRVVGFALENCEYLLHDFARYATERGETHVRAQTATEWAAATRSPENREHRLQLIAIFARHARAEDARHEVPPIFVFGRRGKRLTPHIYSPGEIQRLLQAASELPPSWPLRPRVFSTLFALLASTGLRVSEALNLRYGDVTADGLVIRKAKFNKRRLVPMHPTVGAALDRYLQLRRRTSALSDSLFISRSGGRLSRKRVGRTFAFLRQRAGLCLGPGSRRPRVHDIRHTFAVRALEAAGIGIGPVDRYVRALSTYLGHSSVATTCWYLHATPHLMGNIADACERFLEGAQP